MPEPAEMIIAEDGPELGELEQAAAILLDRPDYPHAEGVLRLVRSLRAALAREKGFELQLEQEKRADIEIQAMLEQYETERDEALKLLWQAQEILAGVWLYGRNQKKLMLLDDIAALTGKAKV